MCYLQQRDSVCSKSLPIEFHRCSALVAVAIALLCPGEGICTVIRVSLIRLSLSAVASMPAPSFTCSALFIAQLRTFKYLGLHFHDSGDIAYLIQPIKNKAAGSWALFSGVILFGNIGINVGALSTFICNCYSPSWCLGRMHKAGKQV